MHYSEQVLFEAQSFLVACGAAARLTVSLMDTPTVGTLISLGNQRPLPRLAPSHPPTPSLPASAKGATLEHYAGLCPTAVQ